jgi:hypothetical protein
MSSNVLLRCAALFLASNLLFDCGGASTVLGRAGSLMPATPAPIVTPTPTPMSSGAAPPASLAAITPAPGLPTPPPASQPQLSFPGPVPSVAASVETLSATMNRSACSSRPGS